MKFPVLIIASVLLLFNSCRKDKPEVDVFYFTNDVVETYKIKLSNDTIREYAVYKGDQLTSTTKFQFFEDSAIVITTRANGTMIRKTTNHLDNAGNTISSLDSLFEEDGSHLFNTTYAYSYENGYLVEKIVNSDLVYHYTINQGNTEKVTIDNDYCGYTFSHYPYPNIIDVRNFSNHRFGHQDNYLVSRENHFGCPCGPSSTSSIAEYKYEFNADGTIYSMETTSTPCQHTGYTLRVYISTKRYEYEYL